MLPHTLPAVSLLPFPPSPLLQPAFQPCGSAAPALWHSFRSHHLLPLQGVPLFNADGSKPKPPPAILPGSSAPLSYRWKVVLAAPTAAQEDSMEFQALAVTAQAVKEQLGQVFGRDRVVVYDRMPVMEGEWSENQMTMTKP